MKPFEVRISQTLGCEGRGMLKERKTEKSKELYERAKRIIPAGVSSNPRAYPVWNPYPIAIHQGKGSKIYDIDGNEYIDMFISYGQLILGHSHNRLIEAVNQQLKRGTMFGSLAELEVCTAEKISKMVPCAEMVRFTNTGTEGTMHAIRTIRAYTGKKKIVKFEGHYHGLHDYVLVSIHTPLKDMGPEMAPFKVAASPGIPEETLESVIVLPWNNLEVLEKTVKKYANEIAAVIMEPIMASAGIIMPEEGYLRAVRKLTEENGIGLIFDEVITGFRIAQGGAQEYFGVIPDMAVFAKALGNGFPIGCLCGKREIMELIAPGKVMVGGTYCANPLSLSAAYVVLEELSAGEGAAYKHMFDLGNKITKGLKEAAENAGHNIIIQGLGPIFQIYFTNREKIRDLREYWMYVDEEKFNSLAWEFIRRGVYMHPSNSEENFISVAHTAKDAERIIEVANEAFKAIKIKQG